MKGLTKKRHWFFDPFFDFFVKIVTEGPYTLNHYLRVSLFEKERTNAINNEMELHKLKKMGNVRRNHNEGAFTLGVHNDSRVESRNTMLAIKDLHLVAMKILC